MFIGIDFGTVNTVVMRFRPGEGVPTPVRIDKAESTPSAVAVNGKGQLVFGSAALSADTPVLGLKNLIRDHKGRKAPSVELTGPDGPTTWLLRDVLTAFFTWIKQAVDADLANRGLDLAEPMAVVITVPQNCHDLQRRAVRDAAMAAGFPSCDILNEPSAAALGLAASGITVTVPEGGLLAVYDFGGGTFDCSLLKRQVGGRYTEIDSEGVRRCGGGDVDDALVDMAMTELAEHAAVQALGWQPDAGQAVRLRRQCEKAKIDLANDPDQEVALLTLTNVIGTRSKFAKIRKEVVGIEREQLLAVAKPLVTKTMVAMGKLLKRNSAELDQLCAVILTGGSSALPGVHEAVQRSLDRLGRSGAAVIASDRSMHDVAMGAAYASADTSLIERRTALHFGVWRVEHGTEWFDVLVPRGESIDPDQPIERRVAYQPTHDIGAFRYCQCTDLVDANGNEVAAAPDAAPGTKGLLPAGDILEYPSAIRIPFVPELRGVSAPELDQRDIVTTAPTVAVVERYTVDSDGIISISIECDDSTTDLSLDFNASLSA